MVLWINIPLMALAFGLLTALPLWLVFRRPDEAPARSVRVGVSGQPAAEVPAPRVPAAEVPAAEVPAPRAAAEQPGTHAPRAGAPAVPRQPGNSEQRSVDA